MHQCISIYPNKTQENTSSQIHEYIALAKLYGFNEVFTSINLPEWSIEDQLNYLELIAEAAHQHNMELTADIGGPFIRKVLQDESSLLRIKNTRLDYLRLDYGYDFKQLETLYHQLNLKGFVINASMMKEAEIRHHLEQFHQIDSAISIRACHNFYVREESGLDSDFALSQTQLFKKYDIPVYYCAPSYDHPRGPLCLGLPTLEHHRYQPLDFVLLELIHRFHADGILYSDEWMSENLFKLIQQVTKDNLIQISVILRGNLTEIEKRIVISKHIFRYDSNQNYLRSRSSREMAEFAHKIVPDHCVERNAGCITIDNERYLRYSGELQVVLQDAKQDDRVNVVAHLQDLSDLKKLAYFREGYTYELIEADEHLPFLIQSVL